MDFNNIEQKKENRFIEWWNNTKYFLFIILLIAIMIGILVAFGFHCARAFNLNYEIDKSFAKWLIDNKEYYEKIIVINPNFKPEFVIEMTKHYNTMVIGAVVTALPILVIEFFLGWWIYDILE